MYMTMLALLNAIPASYHIRPSIRLILSSMHVYLEEYVHMHPSLLASYMNMDANNAVHIHMLLLRLLAEPVLEPVGCAADPVLLGLEEPVAEGLVFWPPGLLTPLLESIFNSKF